MAIPVILPYAMPGVSDLPQNKVAWKADPKRSVLLIHDMQQYFLNAYPPETSPLIELLENIQLLKRQCVEMKIPVVYTAQPGAQSSKDRALLQDFWGPGLADDPGQTNVVDAVAPAETDTVFTKWRYSAFKKTKLKEFMRIQGRDQLIICGVYAHIGCLLTACDAFMNDLETFLVGDALADFSLAHHQMALKYAAANCGVTITTALVIDELKKNRQTIHEEATNVKLQELTLQELRQQVAELFDESAAAIDDNEDLIDRGLDSIRMMSLVEKWRRIRADVTFMKLVQEPTISAWWNVLSNSK